MAMHSKYEKSSRIPGICIIIFTALLIQFIGRYYAGALVIGKSFYLSWVLLRIVIPVAVLAAMRVPLTRAGLGLPDIDRKTGRLIIFIIIGLILAFAGIYFMKGYFDSYAGAFHGADRLSRFIDFMIFTASTLTGWEFLHRGFLLMGILYVLTEREKLTASQASVIAVAVVWIFEVLFHFIKPDLEALGMLVGSPVLSWLALRTKSIWIPFLIHLLVEILFIVSLIMR